jgi:predicted Zn-dependent protease
MDWKQRRKSVIGRHLRSILLVALFAAVLVACSTVPLTGRQQLSLISPPVLMKMSVDSYREVLSKSKLSTNRSQTALVRRVGTRIARASEEFMRNNGLEQEISNYDWEFNLIKDDETINAWCMPGGKIAVYTGILPICRDENGLAVAIGHEVAHALAQHGGERMSQALLAQMGGVALSVALAQKPAATQQLFMMAYGIGVQVGFLLPYSRQHESEADRIGLTLMAMAGYDPRGAVPFWERMAEQGNKERPAEFLSTHPAPNSRIEDIEYYIPEALEYYRPVKAYLMGKTDKAS